MCWLYGRKKNKRLQQNKRSLLNEQNLNESKVMTLWRLHCADVEEVRELQLAQPFCSKSVGKEKKKKHYICKQNLINIGCAASSGGVTLLR